MDVVVVVVNVVNVVVIVIVVVPVSDIIVDFVCIDYVSASCIQDSLNDKYFHISGMHAKSVPV